MLNSSVNKPRKLEVSRASLFASGSTRAERTLCLLALVNPVVSGTFWEGISVSWASRSESLKFER
jgi:hypothetical protein